MDTEGKQLGSKKFYSTGESFTHLGFTVKDLSKLQVQLYDNAKNLKYTADFDQIHKQLIVK